jgi:hypothetical protein
VQLTLNSRDTSSTGISSFFLEHGYNLEVLDLAEGVPDWKHTCNPWDLEEMIAQRLWDAQK